MGAILTAIAGIVDGATVWLAGDSANTTDDHCLIIQAQSKVFKRAPFVLGGCGTAYWCEWLLSLSPPKGAGIKWLRDSIVALAEGHELDECDGGLVGYNGALWALEGKAGVVYRVAGKIAADGDGGDVAYGSLCRTAHLSPRARLTLALSDAESRCSTVRRPFRYCHT